MEQLGEAKQHRRTVLALLVVMFGVFLTFRAMPAFSNMACSPHADYGPLLGYSYYNEACVTDDFVKPMEAMTYVTSKSGDVPTGYMGAQASLYLSDGTLCGSSGMYYNPAPISAIDNGSPQCTSYLYYYSRGSSAAYNGGGYSFFYTDESPRIQAGSSPSSPPIAPKAAPVYLKNASGMTYGSGLEAPSPHALPDLVQAVGLNGTHGYVRSSDVLGPLPTTPQEALARQVSEVASGGRHIPLFALDGQTVIDTFVVSPPKSPN